MNENNCNLCNLDGYYLEHLDRKEKTRGGVGIYISHSLKHIFREDLCVFIEVVIESCFIEIINNKNSKHIIVGELCSTNP